jgi:uncharacterized protein (TIGR03435 family)
MVRYGALVVLRVLLCLIDGQASPAQPPPVSGPEPKFEVASVRLANAPDQATSGRSRAAAVTFSGARVTINGFALKDIIARAYRTETYLIAVPDWTAHASVVIQALMPPGAMKDQLPEMLKALLLERFHLVAHKTAREEPVFALVTGRGGPKLKPPRDLDPAACAGWSDKSGFDDFQGCNKVRQIGDETARTQVSVGGPNGPARFEITPDGDIREEYLKMNVQQLALRMSVPCDVGCLNLPVVDRTGIAGDWDITLDRTCSAASNCDTYASALEKIGLKLEKTIAPVERLVIDQIDKVPTEN